MMKIFIQGKKDIANSKNSEDIFFHGLEGKISIE